MDEIFAYEYIPAARLLVTGEDAADFLQSQFSNELRPFQKGQCVYGLWLDVKGRVVADSWVLCESAERFQVISEHCSAELITDKLTRCIIADDVVIKELESAKGYALFGDGASDWLERCPKSGIFLRFDEHIIFRGRRSVAPSYELLFESEVGGGDFRLRLEQANIVFIDKNRLQIERMQAGIPEVPIEIGSSELQGEGGFERDAVSFSKGCYLGQEIVARMHHLGQARRALYIIEGEGAVSECPAQCFNDQGKNVGELRSAVPTETAWRGVALLKIQHISMTEAISIGKRAARLIRKLRE